MANRSGVLLVTLGMAAAVGDPVFAVDGYHVFIVGTARVVVLNALDGAARRLSRAECRRVFDDFVDADGRSLEKVVDATAKRPEDLLATLYFVDAEGTPQCRIEHMELFTAPGSHVVHVCPRFAEIPRHSDLGEMLIIHELLHMLGLGENPPASGDITRAVHRRCG